MRMKFYFLLLILLICLLGGMVIFLTFDKRGTMFYIAEAVIAAGIILTAMFYRHIIHPFNTIASGMDLLREQDFSSRLAHVRQPDVDKIVDIFNRMMEQLKSQRLNAHERNALLERLIAVSPMGIVMLDFDGRIVSANPVAIKMLLPEESEICQVSGLTLAGIGTPLATAIDRLKQESIETIRLSSSRIYRCSRLSFMDRGSARPFVMIESLTDEVMAAEKQAYGKIIRMIAHEVNNTMTGLGATLCMIDDALATSPDNDDLRSVLGVCNDRCSDMTSFISAYANRQFFVTFHGKPVRRTRYYPPASVGRHVGHCARRHSAHKTGSYQHNQKLGGEHWLWRSHNCKHRHMSATDHHHRQRSRHICRSGSPAVLSVFLYKT